MQQRGGVNELDAGGETDMALSAVAAEPRGRQRQHRPQPLAAGGDDVTGQLRDQGHRAMHAIDDRPVYMHKIVADQRRQLIERGALTFAFFLEIDDNRHGHTPYRLRRWPIPQPAGAA